MSRIREYRVLLSLLVLLVALSSMAYVYDYLNPEENPEVKVFETEIESGSGHVEEIGVDSYRVLMEYDFVTNSSLGERIGHEMYWWGFNITHGMVNRTVEFWVPQNFLKGDSVAEGATLSPNNGQWPVVSEDNGETWSYLDEELIFWFGPEDGYDRYHLKFNYTFTTDTALISVAFPHLYSALEDYAFNISAKDYVKVDYYNSTLGRKVLIFTIKESDLLMDDKPTVWIIAGQEPSETWAQIIARGVIEYLVSDTVEASNLRKKYVWKVTPMINPDGNFLGKTQRNANDVDLTQEWDEYGTPDIEAEINGTMSAIEDWIQDGHNVSVFIDIHNSYTHGWQVIYPSRWIVDEADLPWVELLRDVLRENTIWGHRGSFGWSNREKSTQAVYLRFGVPGALLEGGQWQKYIVTYPMEIGTIEALKQKGEDLVKALDIYLESVGEG